MTQGKTHHCCARYFPRFWHYFRNVAIIIMALCWKIGVKDTYLLKWHDVSVRLKNSGYIPWEETPFPWKGFHMWRSSTLFPCFHCPGDLGSGSFSLIYFHSKWYLILCFPGMRCLKKKFYSEMPHMFVDNPIIMQRSVFPRVGTVPSSRKFQPTGCHGNGMMTITTCETMASCESKVASLNPMGSSYPLKSRVVWWAPWVIILEVFWCQCKEDPSDVCYNDEMY